MLENGALQISYNFSKVTKAMCPREGSRLNLYDMGPAPMQLPDKVK